MTEHDYEIEIDSDKLKKAAFDDFTLDVLIAEYGLKEVRVAYKVFARDLMAQVSGRPATEELADWRKRVNSLYHRVSGRLVELNARVREMNRQETSSAHAIGRKWGDFAYRLASELYILAPDILGTMDGPKSETRDINALEWWKKRTENIAARAEKDESR
jgi:hypothetical protein